MLNLAIAMTFSMLITIIMRVSEKYTKSDVAMLAANYVTCAVMGVIFTWGMDLFPAGEGFPATLGLGVFNGALFLGSFMLLKWNVSKNGVVLPTTFMRLGVLVPTMLSVVLFGEIPGVMQIIGIVLALAAILLMQEKGGKANSLMGLVILLFVGGCADAMSKVFETYGNIALKDHFLIYTFGIALILCAILCIIRKQKPGIPEILFGVLLGVPNYLSTRFLLLSLADVPAVIAYPTYSAGTIVLVAIVGMLCFREKLNRRKLISLGIILAALVLLNL